MSVASDFANLQIWFDASQITGLSNGQEILTVTDFSSNARHAAAFTTTAPLYSTNVFPTGRPAYNFDGVDDYVNLVGAIDIYIDAAQFSLFVSFIVDSIDTDSANTYLNNALWGDNTGEHGVFFKSTGPKICSYNWDGTDDHNDITIALGTPYVYHMRHEAGVLYHSINGGTEQSVASGNTSDVTGDAWFGAGTSRGSNTSTCFDGKIGELFVFDVARTTGEISGLIATMMSNWISAGTPVAKPQRPRSPLPAAVARMIR